MISVSTSSFREFYVTLASYIPFILHGCFRSFTSLFLDQVKNDDSGIIVDNEDASWIVCIFYLTMPIGCIIGGILSDKLGRKTTLQLTFVFFTLSSLSLIFANHVRMIYGALTFSGIGSGMSMSSMVYVSEISSVRNRGFLSAFGQPTVAIGFLLSNGVTYFLRWRKSSVCILAISAVFFIFVSLIPESPVWLIMKHKERKARKVLEWLRNSETGVKEEMDEIEKQRGMMNSKKNTNCMKSIEVISNSWKHFLLIFGLSSIQQFTGFNILISYGSQFFDSLDIPMDSSIASIMYFMVNIIRASLAPVVTYYLSRNRQLIISGTLAGICWTIVLIYEILFLNSEEKPYFWIVPIAVYAFNFSLLFGITYIPMVVAGELFVGENRGLLIGTFGVGYYIISGVVIKLYIPLVTAFGIISVLALCAVGCYVTVVYAIFVMPETGNKSLIEIQEQYFSKSGEREEKIEEKQIS